VAIDAAEQSSRNTGQNSLFGDSSETITQALPNVAPWPEKEKLIQEKVALGFYFSGHPYTAYKAELEFIRNSLDALIPQDHPQMLAGVVIAVRAKMTMRGKMAFVTLDDGSAQIEVAVGNELFIAQQALLKEDQLLVVEGKVSPDSYTGGLRVNAVRLMGIATARTAHAQALKIICNGQASAAKLRELLAPYQRRDACRVRVSYRNASASCEAELDDNWNVELREELLQGLREWLSKDNVKILYH
jgi:DNA polymerase-3 subunit alpha